LKASLYRALAGAPSLSAWNSKELIRSELFSAERLEQHAASLAAEQRVRTGPMAGRSLAARLRDNKRILLGAYRAIALAMREGRAISPAADWLVDNYHVVEAQIQQIHDDLPRGYYRQLPKLADGPLAGYPRVFGIAWAFVAHTDSRFDPQLLCRFVRAYQQVQPLTIGELWALAITLRIVLVENLRRAAVRIADGRAARQQADTLADQLLGLGATPAEPAAALLQEWDGVHLSTTFAVQLLHRLRDQDANVAPALDWLAARLAAQGTTPDAIVREEHHRQGASNLTVRNVITSMRSVSAIDWADLFESVSLVDIALRAAGDFAQMDFPTRDRYRRGIEELARGSTHTELEITQRAIELTRQAQSPRERDPGYHLIGGGRQHFESAIHFRAAVRDWATRAGVAAGIRGYLAAVAAIAAVVLAVPLLALFRSGTSAGQLALLAVLGLIPAVDAAMALVNRSVTKRFGAKSLPALELRAGVPAQLRTLVAVPTLFTTPAALAEHLGRLEIHHLASPDGELYFALLADFRDADAETLADDAALVAAATAGIAQLNLRHGAAPAGPRFLLLHRRRLWSETQGQWIGWERKRGKLHELNRLLRGATDTSFVLPAGTAAAVPADVRYVITLDADTRLPRDAARRLVGKLAHPLNAPRFDAASGRVVEGYAVLQPRVSPSLPLGREGSLYQRLYSSASGIDPYSAAVSDVYQDLCGEGSYVGKGIYDVDVFEAALAERIPDGRLLSHDLFEGIFARAGLVSDVEVVEEYPARYDVAAARIHRWTRGDWQLLPWLFGRGVAGEARRRSRIPLIGRWKMLDNLRRTLSAPAAIAALIAGWTLPAKAALLWTALVLLTLAIPQLSPVLAGIISRRGGVSRRSRLRTLGADLRIALSQIALLVVFLAHQAWLMVDAIVRTLFRLAVSRRRLLEWLTAAQAQTNPRLDLAGFYRLMWGGIAIGLLVACLAVAARINAALALPFAMAWLLSPLVARWVSRSPSLPDHLAISAAETLALRLIARRAWHFFDTFVTPADHMLPPDNFQEDPRPVLAHRTSPTNLGLYLLSAVTARDFGWIGTLDMTERLETTLAEMNQLERFRGHFYNWYDTQDRRPLDPKYVSSVDSGNLAAHLLTVANACSQIGGQQALAPGLWAGIGDGARLARAAIGAATEDDQSQAGARNACITALDTLIEAAPATPAAATDVRARLISLAALADAAVACMQALPATLAEADDAEALAWAQATRRAIASHARDVATASSDQDASLPARLQALAAAARTMAAAMRFDFLYDPERKLLSIGYQVTQGSLDPSCYDLLASEARLASFIAIASGDLPARHWFRLGRAVTPVHHGAALVSWSGSMFEYLMPSLVMRAPTGSLLAETSRLIVQRQIAYGGELNVPWGISESAYNARDMELTYQYSSFGVPDLGLKRGLGANVVIAPYATALAAMVEPRTALRNFTRLAGAGAQGRYGFYEALDYTPQRLPEGKLVAVVRAYMAHHQGMTVVALANALLNGVMRDRFHAEPLVQASELLLQERTPREVAVAHVRAQETAEDTRVYDPGPVASLITSSPWDATPRVRLLSNGRYTAMLTGAGSGYSSWQDLAVTRWREDVTRDDFGSFVFLRDVVSGEVWSAGYQPTGAEADEYQARFYEDRALFVRRDGTLTTTLEVVVSAESDAEVRRVSISNRGSRERIIELTSYAELVLAPPAMDSAHPAFAKLFVQTEYVAAISALLATRRRRSPGDPEVWAAHLAIAEGETVGELQIETDRARFIGRARQLRSAVALTAGHMLSGTVGTVLDPIFSLRRRLRLAPGATARVAFWTLVASTRSEVLDLADKHRDEAAFDRAATLAWTQAQVQLHHLAITADEANHFQRLASHLIYSDSTLRPSAAALADASGGQPLLWAQGISGDLPIVVLRIDDLDDLYVVRQLLRAFEYWRLKQLAVDLIILNERAPSYTQDLQLALEQLIRSGQMRRPIAGEAPRGGVFILRADIISSEARRMVLTAARAVLLSRRGSLVEQIERLELSSAPVAAQPPHAPPHRPALNGLQPILPALEFFNGIGGFGADGTEYVTILRNGQCTPAPWINVIANAGFGFQVSAEGCGYTWAGNSRENQLTPWSNDPVADPPGEVIYLRDDDTGVLWGPSALPVRHDAGTYVARHGRGYSRFETTQFEIALELLQFVPLDAPIKISQLRIRNLSGRKRHLSVTSYVEWVLSASRSASAPYLATAIDGVSGAMLARNLWKDSGGRVAFLDLGGLQTSWTGDRREFLGRNGTLQQPLALSDGAALSGRVGAGLDPCGALQATVELAPNATVEILCLLGEAATTAQAQALVARWRSNDLDQALLQVRHHWQTLLDTVVVKTPDRSFDLMHNGWLLYQTIACRVWARSAFYQASGAYGFRDQLQDTMALVYARPDLTRTHLLRAAARQFAAGDVQHWWLPETGRGVRTRVADDRAWLCYCAAYYVEVTGDLAVLDEPVPFLDGPPLQPGESDHFFQPTPTDESASLYEHCARALEASLAVGTHGLPLFGGGDWNDGMNAVGAGGKGESIWLGWFLHTTLSNFAVLAAARADRTRAIKWRTHAAALRTALERDGWDGDWYRRGFFDDGTPLGSATRGECRIDSIAQSWAVISGAADPGRAQRAMAALDQHLIRRDAGLNLLFTPPFNHSLPDPGYIKAYPPGIRENGGQYTHAAIWSAIAFALQGDGDRAAELFTMLNPINHARTLDAALRYRVEPYVLAADIYSEPPNVGRGGWTWYTGSSAWMYRAGLEHLLGCRLRGTTLLLDPCIPRAWPGYQVVIRYRSSRYEIKIDNPRGVCRGITALTLDGEVMHAQAGLVSLVDDGATHRVHATLG
jgi:cyclic beta-1,2-glucan synthetase